MEELRKSKSAEEMKQEFFDRINRNINESPDVQVILQELLQKTTSIDIEEIPSDLDRTDLMKFAYIMACKYASGLHISVRMQEDMPFAGMGCVQVEGTTIEFANTGSFARIAEFADNTDIYPLSNGKLRIVFIFYNLSGKR